MTTTATQSQKTFTLTKQGERQAMIFIQISDTEVKVCYGNLTGSWIKDEYHPPVGTVHSVIFARQLWKQYKAMGWG
jgi:hypothetical protein